LAFWFLLEPTKGRLGTEPYGSQRSLKVAVISDVHANMEALEAVLRKVDGMDLYCLGDFVDYGAQPNAAIDMLKERGAVAIRGNHDDAALTGNTSLFNTRAAMGSKWTSRRLSQASREYLGGLKASMTVTLGDVPAYFAHGSPDDNLWEYVDPTTHHSLFEHYLTKLEVGLIGLGHTHVPYVWKDDTGIVFNPGSVGQPRDGDPRASYAVITIGSSGPEVEVERVDYDYKGAAAKIRKAGLPESFAERLAYGT